VRSPLSLGILYIVMGGLGLSGLGGAGPLGRVQYGLAAALIAAGVLLLTRLRLAFYLALLAGLATAATGVLGLTGHRELALPLQPAVSVGVGLYLCLRLFLARAGLGRRRRAAPAGDEDEA
jgi:hypothetical protein